MGIIRDISEIVNAIEKDAATYFFGNDNMKSTGLRMASNVRMNQTMATSMPRRSPTQAPAMQTNASKPQGRTGVSLRGTTPVRQLHGTDPVGAGRGKLYLKGTTPVRQLYGTSPVKAGRGRLSLAGTSPIDKLAQAVAIRQGTEKTAQTCGYYAPAHDANSAVQQRDLDRGMPLYEAAGRTVWGGLGALSGASKWLVDAIGNTPRAFGSEKNWWGDDFRGNSFKDYVGIGARTGYDNADVMGANLANGLTFGMSDSLSDAAEFANAEAERRNGNEDAKKLWSIRNAHRNNGGNADDTVRFAKSMYGDDAEELLNRTARGDSGLSDETKWMSTGANIAGQAATSLVAGSAMKGFAPSGNTGRLVKAKDIVSKAPKPVRWLANATITAPAIKGGIQGGRSAYGEYMRNRELEAQIKRQKEINELPQEDGVDWKKFMFPIGGALLAYPLLSSMFGGGKSDKGSGEGGEGEDKEDSMWNRMVRATIPIAGSAAAAYGGHRLYNYMRDRGAL